MADSLIFSAGVRGIESSVDRAWANVSRKRFTLSPVLDTSHFGVRGLNGDLDRFNRNLGNISQRVVGFASAGTIVYGVVRAFKEFIKSTVDTEQALARINVNLGTTAQGITQFGRSLYDIARQTGQTFSSVAKAAEEFARQGLSIQETQRRTRDALVLSRIAAVDSTEAVTDLTAAVNTFQKEALTTTDIVNRLAAVDTRFAVSSRDLGLAISRVGNSAQEAGVTFNQLLGIITAVQQTTQLGGSTIGNAFKTIFARVSRPEVLDQLQRLGIVVRDTNNQVLPGIQLLQNFARSYDKLGQAEQSHAAELVGGVRQLNILKAALNDLSKDYGIYSQAVQVASNSQDAAIRKNEQLNKTLASVVNSTVQSVRQLFSTIGNESLGPFLKTLLGGFEQLRSYLAQDHGLGQAIGQGLIKGFTNVLTGPVFLGAIVIAAKTLRGILSQYITVGRQELGILTTAERRQTVLSRINQIMSQATEIEQKQILTSATVLQQAEAILAVEQRIARTRLVRNAENQALTNVLIEKGFNSGPASKRAAGGYLPAVSAEQSAISQGIGGASPSARPVVIPHFAYGSGKVGPIVANSDEYLVKNYAGGGSAIFNPSMVKAYGLPAGAQKINAAGGLVPNFAGPIGLTRGAFSIGEGAFAHALKSPDADFIFKLFKNDPEKTNLIRSEYAISKLSEEMGLPVAKVFGTAKRAVARGGIYKEFVDGTLGSDLPLEIRNQVRSSLANRFRASGIEPTDLKSDNFIVRKGANLNNLEDIIKNSVVVDPGFFTTMGGGSAREYNRHYYSKADGYLPSLGAAVSREIGAGVLPSSVYIDSDARLRSAGNPLGLLVANRRDEPVGGFQGVNRVLSQGGNPKIAGAAGGFVPNLADFGGLDTSGLRQKSGALVSVETINRLDKLFDSISKAGNTEAASKFGAEIVDLSKSLNPLSEKRVLSKVASEFNRLTVQAQEASKATALRVADFAKAERELSKERIPSSNQVFKQTRAEEARRIALEKEQGFQAINAAEKRQRSVPISSRQLNAELKAGEQELRNIERQRELAQVRINNHQDRAAYGPDYTFEEGGNIVGETGRGLSSSQADRRRAPLFRPLTFSQKAGKFFRSPQATFGLALGAPLAAGFVDPLSQALGVNTSSGTTGGAITGGISGALQGLGSGAIFGPAGAVIGTVAGGLIGAFSKLIKSSEELADQLGKQSTDEKQRLDEVGQFIQLQNQYNEALRSGNLEAAKNIDAHRDQFLRNANPQTLDALKGVGLDEKSLNDLSSRLSNEFSKNETKRNADLSLGQISGGILKKIFSFRASDKEISSAAQNIAVAASSSGFNLARADTKFKSLYTGAGISEADTTKLQALFNRMGLEVKVASSNFVDLVKTLNEAKESYIKITDNVNHSSAVFKNYEKIQLNVIDSLRRAGVVDFASRTSLEGRVSRRQIRSDFDIRQLEGYGTTSQNIGLRGRNDIQNTLDNAALQQGEIDQGVKDKIRQLLKESSFVGPDGEQRLTDEQRKAAFSGNTSLTDLTSFAKAALPANEELSTILKDAAAATEKLKIATDESVRTIKYKTITEQQATEEIRKQTAFSNYDVKQGSNATSPLGIFRDPFYDKTRQTRAEDQAIIGLYGTAKGFGANVDALQNQFNQSSTRNNKENFEKFAEQILSSFLRDRRFRTDQGELSFSALRGGAESLSKFKNPRIAAVGQFVLDNLLAEQENKENVVGPEKKFSPYKVEFYSGRRTSESSKFIQSPERLNQQVDNARNFINQHIYSVAQQKKDKEDALKFLTRGGGGGRYGKTVYSNSGSETSSTKTTVNDRINQTLNSPVVSIKDQDAAAEKSLKAAQILQNAFSAFSKKQNDFNLNLNSQIKVTLEGIDRFYSKEEAQKFQSQIDQRLEGILDKVYRLEGTPRPPKIAPR